MAGSLSGWDTEPKSLMTAAPTMNQIREMELQTTVTRLWLCGLGAVIGNARTRLELFNLLVAVPRVEDYGTYELFVLLVEDNAL